MDRDFLIGTAFLATVFACGVVVGIAIMVLH